MAFPGEEFTVNFHGVRGSTPCSCPSLQRYGGNTSCVSLDFGNDEPVVFDLGTGLRQWGGQFDDVEFLTVHALVTHMHWDHVQGMPFFGPLSRPGTTMNIYGPGDDGHSMKESFAQFMSPPLFPVRPDQLAGEVIFHDISQFDFTIGDVSVMARPVPHTGPTNGYRVTRGGKSVAYISDHQQPLDDPWAVHPAVAELCQDADLLIHDAQFTIEEFAHKSDWGHCTVEYAIEVARQCNVKKLVLFHHDPSHTDDDLDDVTRRAQICGERYGIDILTAAEGMKLTVGDSLH